MFGACHIAVPQGMLTLFYCCHHCSQSEFETHASLASLVMVDCCLLLHSKCSKLSNTHSSTTNKRVKEPASWMYVWLTAYGCYLGTTTLAAWLKDARPLFHFSLMPGPVQDQTRQRPVSKKWRRKKGKITFSYDLPQLFALPATPHPHQPLLTVGMVVSRCSNRGKRTIFYSASLVTIKFPHLTLWLPQCQSFGREGRQNGRKWSNSGFCFLPLAHFPDVTPAFPSKSSSLFYTPESFQQQHSAFGLLYFPSLLAHLDKKGHCPAPNGW